MIYFDNAASSWPKPKGVAEAMVEAVQEYAANPGRGGHELALKASRTIFQTRVSLTKLFGAIDPKNIIFHQNATGALNQAIKGFKWQKGDQVIATMYEHNSVRRPLEHVSREYGVEVIYLQPDNNGSLERRDIKKAISDKTKLIACTHMSNLTGAILPVHMIGDIAKEHNIPFY